MLPASIIDRLVTCIGFALYEAKLMVTIHEVGCLTARNATIGTNIALTCIQRSFAEWSRLHLLTCQSRLFFKAFICAQKNMLRILVSCFCLKCAGHGVSVAFVHESGSARWRDICLCCRDRVPHPALAPSQRRRASRMCCCMCHLCLLANRQKIVIGSFVLENRS